MQIQYLIPRKILHTHTHTHARTHTHTHTRTRIHTRTYTFNKTQCISIRFMSRIRKFNFVINCHLFTCGYEKRGKKGEKKGKKRGNEIQSFNHHHHHHYYHYLG